MFLQLMPRLRTRSLAGWPFTIERGCRRTPYLQSMMISMLVVGGVLLASSGCVEDQERIAFLSERDGADKKIFVMAPDGTNVVDLNHRHDRFRIGNIAWSPSGERIVFSAYDDGVTTMYAMSTDGTDVARWNYRDYAFKIGKFALSPDGERIAFSSDFEGDADIYVMDVDETIVLNRITDHDGWDGEPAWSPDGERIAFSSKRGGWGRHIYIMNADGTGVMRLSEGDYSDGYPAWSPDGAHIAFSRVRDTGVDIHVMKANGDDVRRVADTDGSDTHSSWSPDGKRIAFSPRPWVNFGRRAASNIYVVNTDGTGIKQLTNDDMMHDWEPAWSP